MRFNDGSGRRYTGREYLPCNEFHYSRHCVDAHKQKPIADIASSALCLGLDCMYYLLVGCRYGWAYS